MVNTRPATQAERQKLYDHFIISTRVGAPAVQILFHPDLSAYSVLGAHSVLLTHDHIPQIPLKFHKVQGSFYAQNSALTTLMNSPEEVDGDYHVHGNPLENLDHAPAQISGAFQVTCHANLPLLRCLVAKKGTVLGRPPLELKRILNKYMGQGKQAMLNCALELKQAGYVGNARW